MVRDSSGVSKVVDTIDGAGAPGDAEGNEEQESHFGVSPRGSVGFQRFFVASVGRAGVKGSLGRWVESGAWRGGVDIGGILLVTFRRCVGVAIKPASVITADRRRIEEIEACQFMSNADLGCLQA